MIVKILKFSLSASPLVQAFIDVELDGWLRFNGQNLLRDGTLKSAQLTPMCNGRRLFFDAVESLDADLRELLTAEILDLSSSDKHLRRQKTA